MSLVQGPLETGDPNRIRTPERAAAPVSDPPARDETRTAMKKLSPRAIAILTAFAALLSSGAAHKSAW